MNYNKKVDIVLDKNTFTAKFRVNLVGEKTKQTYMGLFKVKALLTPYDIIKADKLFREILGVNSSATATLVDIDEHVKSLAFALAQLNIRILEAPTWWENNNNDEDEYYLIKGMSILDENILLKLLEYSIEAEQKMRKELSEEFEVKKEEAEKELFSEAKQTTPAPNTPNQPNQLPD